MKNVFRKIICVVLSIVTLAGMFITGAMAAEPTGFEQIDSPMLYNTTDSSKLDGYTPVSLSDVYGQIDTDSAKEIESLFSDDAVARFSEELGHILDFEPVENEEAAPVLGAANAFVSNGGMRNFLQSGNLTLGAEIGLTENKDAKVKVLGANNAASGWVFVVDKDAICCFIKDRNGNGLQGALVTISYIDDSNTRVTKSVVTTGDHTPGIAVFDDLPEAFSGIVDIQAEGYRAVSILDKDMASGDHYTFELDESKEDDLYVRGVDLSGLDLVNEETKLELVTMDTEDLSLKVIVTTTGNASFPDSIDIYSENREKTILTVSNTSGYAYDDNTKVYVADKRWVEENSGLLKDGDQVSVKLGSDTFELEHVTVENAVLTPGTNKTDMPLTTQKMPGKISDRLGGTGLLDTTFDLLQVPVTVGFFPDGNIIIMASYDITRLDPNTQYKYSSLFDKSWNPKTLKSSERTFQVFEKSFWENAEKVKGGKAVLNSPDKIKCLTNKNYNFSMSFSVFLRSCYNEETDDHYGVGGIMFSGSFSGGITEYFLFTAGPIVIPAYIGFEAGIAINTSLNISFNMDKPPVGEASSTKWKYANNGDTDASGRIEVILSFSVFGGVGVKGVLGAGATGYVNMDIATVMGKGYGSTLGDPHSFIDLLYGLRIDYYLLFFSGSIKLDCLNGAVRIADSNGEKDRLLADNTQDIEFQAMDLGTYSEDLVPILNESGESHDDAYMLRNSGSTLELGAKTSSVDSNTYPDNQLQAVSTRNYTALFRIVVLGGQACIMYQLQSRTTGDILPVFYFVKMPEGETRSVTEFVVVPNKTDWNDPDNCDKVYIGAVLADDKLTDENERLRSTDVAAMVVDLDRTDTVSSVIVSNPANKGAYLYSAPMPAGREDYCSVAYAATSLRDEVGKSVDGMKELLTVIPTYTSYQLSYCDPGKPETRYYTGLGTDKIHSSGVIAPNEPSYWAVDPLSSSDKYLVVKGYGSNGYYERDLRCNFRVDIDGMVDPADLYSGKLDFNDLITNWQYLNGCNYFIAGDSVFAMEKKSTGSDPSNYEWVAAKAVNGSGVVCAENSYAFITNNNQSAIYLIGVVEDYDVDMEAGTAVKTDNRVQIYTLTRDLDWVADKEIAKLHGPLELSFAYGEVINSFTASYNPDECNASGLTVIYNTPSSYDAEKTNIHMWNQNADRGLLVTDVRIPDYLVKEDQAYIDLYVSVRNYGYGRENAVSYTIHDENGYWFTQYINGQDVGETFYTGTDMYTGDTRVDKITIKPNPNWTLNKEHEIIVDVTSSYKYNGDLDNVVNMTATLKADNTSLTAANTLIGGRHYVSTTITNNSIIGEETPIIKAEFKYSDPGREKTMRFQLPTNELLYMYDEEDEAPVEQAYHYDIDMNDIWEEGIEEGLEGIYFLLVDSEDVQQSNEVVYVVNPEETVSHDCPSAKFVDVDKAAWYHEAVDYAVANGLMNGTSAKRFEPATATTRAMIVTILHRLEGEPVVNAINPFDDVIDGAWYTDAIIWAADNGIIEGYGDGRFGPNDDITREQLATILYRYAEYKGYDVSAGEDTNILSYDDYADISEWAIPAIQWAVGTSLIKGRTDSTVVPRGGAKRAETAIIFMRFIESLE
ncbi:MAG: S-layer homology domain-containing protein [Oscillospiraceae bacterium]|nr:S-layer homology domain-containing protein [Oscillospiraceae bacterium]